MAAVARCGKKINELIIRKGTRGGGPSVREGSPLQEASLWAMVFRCPIGERTPATGTVMRSGARIRTQRSLFPMQFF